VITNSPTPTTVTHLSGQKFAIRIRSHELIVDQTLRGGGDDTAPTPLELLGASLGSCIAYYMHHFFHTRGLSAEGLVVSVTNQSASNPSRIESFSVRIVLPAEVPAHFMPLLERVLHACPAHNTLVMGSRVEVKFEAPAAASEPALTAV
jgi:uncharacterized OsmC-like protein